MQGHDIVVVGASAGGIEPLKVLVGGLPADFPGTVFIVLHVAPHSPGLLPSILAKVTQIPVLTPEDGKPIELRKVYVTPPDHHLLLDPEHLRIVRGPKENRHRPSVDVLFRSAAWAFGPRVVGVVLSGTLDDGAAGLWTVKTCGGTTIVQDPDDAQYPDMPSIAKTLIDVDYSLPANKIPVLLIDLASEPANGIRSPVPDKIKIQNEFATMNGDISYMNKLGQPSAYTCPACRGALWEVKEGQLVHYRCHIGHAFSPDSLLVEQSEALDVALDSALRAAEEKSSFLTRLADRLQEKSPRLAENYRVESREMIESIDLILRMLTQSKKPVEKPKSE